MIESQMFKCPRGALETGLVVCDRISSAAALLRQVGDAEAASFAEPLELLRKCYEGTLWAAVDFHSLRALQDHYISGRRTAALLENAGQEIRLPQEEDARALDRLFSEAIAAADDGSRACRVQRPGIGADLDAMRSGREVLAELIRELQN